MVDSNDSWLSKNKKLIAIVASTLVIAIIVILIGYQFDWTGFNTSSITAQTNATKGTTLPTNLTVTLPSKTLYDWMQLLIIPFVIAVAGYVINITISRGEQEATIQRDKTERDIALERQHEATLKEYHDKMSELLLHENLRNSSKGDEVRNIANIWTALTLSRVDVIRKYDLVAFLSTSKLIEADNIVDLEGCYLDEVDFSDSNEIGLNLSGAIMTKANLSNSNFTNFNLSNADLTDANLSNTNFTNTNLSNADLTDADLTDADLTNVKVTPEQLAKAKSLKGATMPDGSIHP